MRDVIDRGWDERTVTVDRQKLIETLKSNREKHSNSFREAISGYKHLAMERLVKLRERAKANVDDNFDDIKIKIERFNPNEESLLSDTVTLVNSMNFHLEVPQNHTKSYDVAIQMAEWEVNPTVELTQSQFQCFVLDDWDWKKKFESLSKSYSVAAGKR